MSAVARSTGADVYPDDPEGDGNKTALLTVRTWREHQAADRANSLIFPAGGGIVGKVTARGCEVRLANLTEAPFSVSLSLAETGGYLARVTPFGSTLQNLGFNPTDTIAIEGLGVWRGVTAGSLCYLRGSPSGSWRVVFGGEWAPGLPPFTLNEENEAVNIFRLIAKFEVDELGGSLRVRQILRNALRLESRLESGVYLDYPVIDAAAAQ